MKSRASVIEIVLSSLLTASVMAVALVFVAREVRSARHPLPRPDARDTLITDWEEYALSGIRMGPDEAVLTVLEFMDFEAPFAQRSRKRRPR